MKKALKPHFKLSGGVYETLYRDDEGTNIIMLFTDRAMRDLAGTYLWWNGREPTLARITVSMLMKRTAMYRVTNARGRSKWVINDSLILSHTDSKFIRAYLTSEIDKVRHKKSTLKPAKHYIDMIASGYCRVSNNHCTVSRIDTPEWKREYAIYQKPWDPDSVMISNRTGDTYRRCLSKDKVVNLDPEIYKLFPGSSDGPDYYMPMTGAIANVK